MSILGSGGFSSRSDRTESFVQAIESTILTTENYFNIQTGIEHRFGDQAKSVHDLLYNSMGPTTDLLRYFPDNLYIDRHRQKPTWEPNLGTPRFLTGSADQNSIGLFSFFVEYKYSYSERKYAIGDVPTKYIGIIEREAWFAYRRLTNDIPATNTYLDGQRTLIALFYVATYAPEVLYAQWEHLIEPIAIRGDIALPNRRSVNSSTGSGTPWINFDIRTLKPLEVFLEQDLFWEGKQANAAVKECKRVLFT